jgi:hypothetical protein
MGRSRRSGWCGAGKLGSGLTGGERRCKVPGTHFLQYRRRRIEHRHPRRLEQCAFRRPRCECQSRARSSRPCGIGRKPAGASTVLRLSPVSLGQRKLKTDDRAPRSHRQHPPAARVEGGAVKPRWPPKESRPPAPVPPEPSPGRKLPFDPASRWKSSKRVRSRRQKPGMIKCKCDVTNVQFCRLA